MRRQRSTPAQPQQAPGAAPAVVKMPVCSWYDDEENFHDSQARKKFLNDSLKLSLNTLVKLSPQFQTTFANPLQLEKIDVKTFEPSDSHDPVTKFSFDFTFKNIRTKKTETCSVEAERRIDKTTGEATFSMQPNGLMTLEKCYDFIAMQTIAMRVQDMQKRDQMIADLQAKPRPLSPQDTDKLNELSDIQRNFSPGKISLDVEDPQGKVMPTQNITVHHQVMSVTNLTHKQAIALQSFLHTCDEVTMGTPPKTYQTSPPLSTVTQLPSVVTAVPAASAAPAAPAAPPSLPRIHGLK